MQNVVFEKPYEFVPPHRGTWWPWLLQRLLPRRLRKNHGVVSVDCRDVEKLLASVSAGHGILLASNHSCKRWGFRWSGLGFNPFMDYTKTVKSTIIWIL